MSETLQAITLGLDNDDLTNRLIAPNGAPCSLEEIKRDFNLFTFLRDKEIEPDDFFDRVNESQFKYISEGIQNNNASYLVIGSLFGWAAQPEGYDFWAGIDLQWESFKNVHRLIFNDDSIQYVNNPSTDKTFLYCQNLILKIDSPILNRLATNEERKINIREGVNIYSEFKDKYI
jgi:hypothetical protein